MNDVEPDLEHYRTLLRQREQELLALEQSANAAAKTVELDQTRIGRLSRMDAMQAQSMAQAYNRRRQRTLQAIGAALQRIERGDYGECIDCGELIDRRRLEFDPTVRRCIQCAGRAES